MFPLNDKLETLGVDKYGGVFLENWFTIIDIFENSSRTDCYLNGLRPSWKKGRKGMQSKVLHKSRNRWHQSNKFNWRIIAADTQTVFQFMWYCMRLKITARVWFNSWLNVSVTVEVVFLLGGEFSFLQYYNKNILDNNHHQWHLTYQWFRFYAIISWSQT